jgi:hypothetical protein
MVPRLLLDCPFVLLPSLSFCHLSLDGEVPTPIPSAAVLYSSRATEGKQESPNQKQTHHPPFLIPPESRFRLRHLWLKDTLRKAESVREEVEGEQKDHQ